MSAPTSPAAVQSAKEEIFMSETQAFPYETRLDIYYKPLEVIDEKALTDTCEFTNLSEASGVDSNLHWSDRLIPVHVALRGAAAADEHGRAPAKRSGIAQLQPPHIAKTGQQATRRKRKALCCRATPASDRP